MHDAASTGWDEIIVVRGVYEQAVGVNAAMHNPSPGTLIW